MSKENEMTVGRVVLAPMGDLPIPKFDKLPAGNPIALELAARQRDIDGANALLKDVVCCDMQHTENIVARYVLVPESVVEKIRAFLKSKGQL